MKTDKIWLLNIINKLISNPKDANDLIIELQKTEPDIAEGLHDISVILQESYSNKKITENIVTNVNEQVLQYAQNNYFYKIKTTDKDDLLDSLITSLNMLGEEINYSTVTKEYFTDIFNTIPDFVIVVNELGNIITVSKNVLEELEETANTITNFSICELFSEKIGFKKLLDSIDGKKIFHFKTIDGSLVPVTIKTANFIESNDQEIRSVFILSNISEIIQYQKELENALKRAEESDRLKSAFLANVSHEIRTPMNGILGFADLLKAPNLIEKDKKEFLEIIEQSGNRMLETINDIIDISKIEAGQVVIEQKEIKLNKELNEIYHFFKFEAEQKEIKLSFQPAFPDNRDIIITDKKMLTGIIINLVKNAIKFTERGRIEYGYTVKKKMLEFFVKDTGIGIAEDNQKFIFNRFAQEEQGLKKQFEGSGLGLSISKAYTNMLGGEIRVESEPTKGSQFYFTIPLKLVENSIYFPDFDKDEKYIMPKKINILIAEDEDITFTFLSIVLSKFTNKFLRAISGKEAIDILKDNPDIDLILMDIRMPEMDGYEATRKIRTFNKDVFIIVQTAYAFTDDKIKAFEAGANDFISKPIKKDMLFSKLSLLFKKQNA